ncbi:MAG: alpha/beta hydrolase family protein, partial [Saprospiraceae bacterium]
MQRIVSFCKVILTVVGLYLPFLAQSQQLISSEFKATFTREQLNAQFGPFAQNGIRLYKLLYTMPDLQGVTDTVSGLLIIPDLSGVAMPALCAMHGTVDSKEDVPSNLRGGYELGSAFAAFGYVTFMPDYLGLGESRGFHPYVHADSEASAGINMLFAVRAFAAQNNILINDQLFITGYSQGGHASMAMHRAVEQNYANTLQVTAAAHLSGPYSISGATRELLLSNQQYFYPAYIPFTLLSYDLAYDIFPNLESVFKPAYAAAIQRFFAGNFTLNGLNQALINQLRMDYGAVIVRNMFQDSVINAVENDPNHPVNRALAANDVYQWAPKAPTRMFYCRADDQVTYRNSIVADSV